MTTVTHIPPLSPIVAKFSDKKRLGFIDGANSATTPEIKLWVCRPQFRIHAMKFMIQCQWVTGNGWSNVPNLWVEHALVDG